MGSYLCIATNGYPPAVSKKINLKVNCKSDTFFPYCIIHGLRTPNEGINQRYLKNWADVEDEICYGRT